MSNESGIVSKVWSFANVLRDDGVSYGDYLTQLTYLLFLKMVDEFAKPPYNREIAVPEGCDWESLKGKRGAELETHYTRILRELAKAKGTLGQIFVKSRNEIQDPAKLYKIIDMVDKEKWSMMGADLKGKIYEGLLEKNAEDTKSGAGQYFTPRALIEAMIACVQPEPMKTIADPACGTGGFFLGAYQWLTRPGAKQNKAQKEFLRDKTFHGNEIVPSTRRMCLMNLFLHNVGELDGEPLVARSDALVTEPKLKVDYVLANPPFGKKSSMTITNEEGEEDKEALTYERQD